MMNPSCDSCCEEDAEHVLCEHCMQESDDASRDSGAEHERAQILTWLRTVAGTNQALRFAECIERGDHEVSEQSGEEDRDG